VPGEARLIARRSGTGEENGPPAAAGDVPFKPASSPLTLASPCGSGRQHRPSRLEIGRPADLRQAASHAGTGSENFSGRRGGHDTRARAQPDECSVDRRRGA
jgi:hypothetical protein